MYVPYDRWVSCSGPTGSPAPFLLPVETSERRRTYLFLGTDPLLGVYPRRRSSAAKTAPSRSSTLIDPVTPLCQAAGR